MTAMVNDTERTLKFQRTSFPRKRESRSLV